ncbi:MAG: hypothetical protein M5R40_27440 [Anaerolineae bacterium]|nr:hypothetical protein [Anaerolineae bacterium]
MGARQCLVSLSERRRGEAIAGKVRYLELTNDPRFVDRFSQAVLLDENPGSSARRRAASSSQGSFKLPGSCCNFKAWSLLSALFCRQM